MPPIFGILNTKLQPPDPGMIERMKGKAQYVKPRMLETLEVKGGFFAAAVVTENPLTEGKDTMAVEGDWVAVGDVSLYKKEENQSEKQKQNEERGSKSQSEKQKQNEERGSKSQSEKQNENEERRGEGVNQSEKQKQNEERGSKSQSEKQKQNEERKESDMRIVMEAWMKRGRECVKYLYGDFAFVVFNRETGEVFCGRDPMGVRPFFYAVEGDVFVFASELRYVTSSFKTKPALRHDYLLDTLVTVKTKKEFSPFENIFRLKPGHCLSRAKGNPIITQYWQPDPDKRIKCSKEEDYIAIFREKLISAVNMRCKGISELGCELSGGLDSSAITGMAADYGKQHNIAVTAFSNVFPADTGIDFKDEREFIDEMIKCKAIPWIGVDRTGAVIPDLLKFTNTIQGCFVQQDFNVFDRGIYEAAGKKNIQALLSGFGGDELVSARIAMPWNELICDRQWKVIRDEIFYKGITFRSLLKTVLILYRVLKLLFFKPTYSSGVFTQELLNRRFANLPLKHDFANKNKLKKRLVEKYRKPKRKTISRRQVDRIMLDQVPQRMEYCYAATAQYGIENRYPLWDKDLMETCLAFPPWMKQHHGINRYVFRQAIKDFVPEMIWKRNDKSGTTIPQMYYSLLKEKELILGLVNACSGSSFLNEIFDFSRFPEWYERLAKRDKKDMNYLNPGAFYAYLMIMLYFNDHG